MARYDYRCRRCGCFEIACLLGTAPPEQPCPGCGEAATRVVSTPALVAGRTAVTRAVEADHRSASEPTVVATPPPRRPAARPVGRLRAKLPRP
jgi:putative FmdB family regulatory protein